MSDEPAGIDPTSSVPKHLQLKDLLGRMISDGLEPGSPIPSERDLAEQHGLSRMTVRQAINALVADGRLERRLGRGTFVAQPKMDVQIRLVGFTEDMRRRGMTASSRTLSFERIHASSALAGHLEVESGEPVVRLVRLRYADGIPMAIERTHLHFIKLRNAGRAEHACIACAHGQLLEDLPAQTALPRGVTAEIGEVRSARTRAHLEQLHEGPVVQKRHSHFRIELARVEGAARHVRLQR